MTGAVIYAPDIEPERLFIRFFDGEPERIAEKILAATRSEDLQAIAHDNPRILVSLPDCTTRVANFLLERFTYVKYCYVQHNNTWLLAERQEQIHLVPLVSTSRLKKEDSHEENKT